jgi:hypothetical protein
MFKTLVAAALLAFVVSVPCQAADVQTGTWKLNVAKSHFQTSPAPKSQLVTILPDGKDGIKLTVDIVTANGDKSSIAYAAQYDGKQNPRTETGAGAVPGQTVSLTRINDRTAERIAYLKGKKLTTERWEISSDGRTRTVTQSGVGADGKPVNNVLVYEKQ